MVLVVAVALGSGLAVYHMPIDIFPNLNLPVGGGIGSSFGNFGSRGDAAVSLFWELHGLGLGDRGFIRRAAAERHMADIDLVRVQTQVANGVVVAYKARIAAAEAMDDARESVTDAIESLELNLTNIRRGAGLPGATRTIEVLQPIQALAQARADNLAAVLAYDRAQFRLYRAIGQAPYAPAPPTSPLPAAGAMPASAPDARARLATSSDADPGRVDTSRTGAR